MKNPKRDRIVCSPKKGKVKGAHAERECILRLTPKSNQIKENAQINLKNTSAQ